MQKSMHVVTGVWGDGSPLLPQAYFEYPKPMSSPFGIGIFTLGSQMQWTDSTVLVQMTV